MNVREGDIVLTDEGEYALVTQVHAGWANGTVLNRAGKFMHTPTRRIVKRWRSRQAAKLFVEGGERHADG